jgi:hypothetical protein
LSAKRQTKKEDTVNSTLNEKKPIINWRVSENFLFNR